MITALKIFGALLLGAFVAVFSNKHGMNDEQAGTLALFSVLGYWLFLQLIKKSPPRPAPKSAVSPVNATGASTSANMQNPNGARYVLKGVNDVLEVFENKITITPKTNLSSKMIRGLKGSKSIPISSITAIQLRKANPMNGYIQFTLPGGVESTGGIYAAISDENTVFFVQPQNALAIEIQNYIERRMDELRYPVHTATVSLSDEIQKLAALYAQGMLSDDEFVAAKKRLMS